MPRLGSGFLVVAFGCGWKNMFQQFGVKSGSILYRLLYINHIYIYIYLVTHGMTKNGLKFFKCEGSKGFIVITRYHNSNVAFNVCERCVTSG